MNSMTKIKAIISSRYFPLILIVLLGGILRLYGLGEKPLWVDEVHELLISRGGLRQITSLATIGSILEYIITHFMLVFDDGEWVVRLPAAIWGILSIITQYFLARKLFDRATALISSLLLSTSFFHVYYSQEVRFHSLFVLLSLLSFYFLFNAIEGHGRRGWIKYAVLMTLLGWTGILSPTVYIGQGLVVALLIIRDQWGAPRTFTRLFNRTRLIKESAGLKYLLSAIPMIISILLGYLLVKPLLEKVQQNIIGHKFTISCISDVVSRFIDLLRIYSGGWLPGLFVLMAFLILGIITSVKKYRTQIYPACPVREKFSNGVKTKSSGTTTSPLVLTSNGVYIILTIIISIPSVLFIVLYVSKTFYAARYFLVVLPFFMIITAQGIVGSIHLIFEGERAPQFIKNLSIFVTALAVVFVFNLLPLTEYYLGKTKYTYPLDWGAASKILEEVEEDDIIAIDPAGIRQTHFIFVLSYYLRRILSPNNLVYIPEKSIFDVFPEKILDIPSEHVITEDDIPGLNFSGRNVWWVCPYPRYDTWADNNFLRWWDMPLDYRLEQELFSHTIKEDFFQVRDVEGITILHDVLRFEAGNTFPERAAFVRGVYSWLHEPIISMGDKTARLKEGTEEMLARRGISFLGERDRITHTPISYFFLGFFNHKIHEIEKAKYYYKKSLLTENPMKMHALVNLGLIFQGEHERDVAEAYFRMALRVRPYSSSSPQDIEIPGDRAGELKTHLKRIVELDPKLAGPLLNMANVYMDGNNFEKAEELLVKADEFDQDNPWVHIVWGRYFLEKNLLVAARRRLERAVKTSPNIGLARLGMGIVHLKEGYPARAVEELTLASRLIPNEPSVHFHLGVAYRDTGDSERALSEFKRCIKLDPEGRLAIVSGENIRMLEKEEAEGKLNELK